MRTFSSFVEKVKELSLNEKEELHLVLEKLIIEARRDEIATNYKKAKKEVKKLKFTSDIEKLKKMI